MHHPYMLRALNRHLIDVRCANGCFMEFDGTSSWRHADTPSRVRPSRHTTPLFKAALTTRQFERAYAAMWDVRLATLDDTTRDWNSSCGSYRGDIVAYRRCILGWTPMHIVVSPRTRWASSPPLKLRL